MSANSHRLLSRKLTSQSISSVRNPAVDTTIGLFTRAIFSSSGRSSAEALATLMMSRPMSQILSTDSSSNGVHMVSMPQSRISLASSDEGDLSGSRVSEKRLTYFRSVRCWKSGWMKVSSWRNWNLRAPRTPAFAFTLPMPWMMLVACSRSPWWLLARS